MELNINSPAYFSEHYGIDDDVYRYCQHLYEYFRGKEYSESLHTIGICLIAAPQELCDSGEWKESVQLVGAGTAAIISIRMDFQKYYKADSVQKIQLMKETILQAVKKVKSRGKFDFKEFEKDLNENDVETH